MTQRIRRASRSVLVMLPRFHSMAKGSSRLEHSRTVGDVEILERVEWVRDCIG